MQTQYSSIASESLDTRKMTGPEYCIWYHDVMGQNFHVLKHYEHSPTQYTPLAGYYILQGDTRHPTSTATAGLVAGAGNGTSTKGPASKGPGTTAKSATSRATSKSKKGLSPLHSFAGRELLTLWFVSPVAQRTLKQQEHLMNAQFMELVDMFIYPSAQRQHVSLVEKPATPPPGKTAASEAVAGGPRDTPDISLAGPVLGKKRRPMRDRDSDAGSVGGESTVSRKRKKVKMEKRV
ncbi:hypothetical protein AMAG_04196 [Allomyces macrogynus ATCC 38327]|uniref:Uncharacterized protein n=1 Tax=Allomyces macrogynus (strain ATCC 38327) TaxID=578462 RepID=A0A0L0S810_ALLM3|nr:hypothetical protein AMAG_04196 [Allomyces macrogynus ATCC 38327]|eukprot:KNE58637.1 hypothetical protein AMAG_04196 [Allomyces macrogynus ATCC 38327]